MQKYILSLIVVVIFVFSVTDSNAQLKEGKIVYDYTIFYDKITQKLPFLSKEEKDRILLRRWNPEGYTTKMNLFFDESSSLYTYGEANEEQTYSWRNEEFIIYRDFTQKTILEFEETLGKTYVLKDEMPIYKWRVMNELKEIQGHLCMKAVTEDTVKKQSIAAWFAADIPVQAGPERYYGLPGIILGLDINDGDVIVEAVSIEDIAVDEQLKLPKKMKGKAIDYAGMQALITEHFATSIKAQRSPFWSLRY
ncbi:GLPGLI family protein [Spirosomataceae bacterium TFI 002]|nr:GLPGLI family protein [Spirosomataceae bacterium TFI 002]